jgi:alkaline phosphatase
LIYGVLTLALVLLFIHLSGQRPAFHPTPKNFSKPAGQVKFESQGEAHLLVQNSAPGEKPQNVIFLIADGLGFAHVTAARAELVGLDGRLAFERMPITGWLSTHSVSSLGTDSAASATALATGYKTKPGRLGVDFEGKPLRTLFEAAHEQGLAHALVTDSYLWDATPAAFLVHVESRRDYGEVIEQMANSEAQILFGSLRHTESPGGPAEQQILKNFEDGGFTVAANWTQLQEQATSSGRLVGLLREGQIASRQEAPSLVELVRIALERLEDSPQGFVLMVESEELDTSSHGHDYERMVAGIRSLHEVTELALEFARRDRHTLVLFTADHETGGLTLLNASPGEPIEVRWGTTGHTAIPVPLYAFGPGAEHLAGARNNIEVAPILAKLLGIPFKPVAAPPTTVEQDSIP